MEETKEEIELFKECGKGVKKTYFISNYGNCKSIDILNKREYIIKPFKLTKGYLGISINGKTEKIHRLVALHFIGERPYKLEIDHIDRNKNNNKVSNLRYISGKENVKNTDRYRLDLPIDPRLRSNQRSAIWLKKNKEKVKKYRETNKEKAKKYRNARKEEIKEKKKEWYEQHKDEISKKKKVKYTCECGLTLTKASKSRHEKSQKHINYMNSKK